MPNIKSSKKAVKVIAKKTDNNHELKATAKNSIKNCEKAIAAKDYDAAFKAYENAQKNIDRATAKGLMSKNTADRQKSRLSSNVKKMK